MRLFTQVRQLFATWKASWGCPQRLYTETPKGVKTSPWTKTNDYLPITIKPI